MNELNKNKVLRNYNTVDIKLVRLYNVYIR